MSTSAGSCCLRTSLYITAALKICNPSEMSAPTNICQASLSLCRGTSCDRTHVIPLPIDTAWQCIVCCSGIWPSPLRRILWESQKLLHLIAKFVTLQFTCTHNASFSPYFSPRIFTCGEACRSMDDNWLCSSSSSGELF